MSHAGALFDLPPELLLVVVKELCKADLLSFRLTCHYANGLCFPQLLDEIGQEMKTSRCQGKKRKLYLHSLVADSSHDLLQHLLNHGPPLDLEDSAGETALHVAARKGCVRCVQTLLRHGAQPSPLSRWGWTPLMAAVREGHAEVAGALIMSGADPSIRGFHGWTALQMFDRLGQRDVANLIKSTGGKSERVQGNEICVGK